MVLPQERLLFMIMFYTSTASQISVTFFNVVQKYSGSFMYKICSHFIVL
jgi:hypothetical protein